MKKEVKILAELFPTGNTATLAKMLGRSKYAIRSYAARLGLRKGTYWTKEEDDILRAFYKTEIHRKVAQRIGRSRDAIRKRAWRLNLHKEAREKERQELTDTIGKETGMILKADSKYVEYKKLKCDWV
jgi:hypothetical protein